MTHLTNDYYFITFKSFEGRPTLGPDEDTDLLNFDTENVTSDFRRPLFFTNTAAEAYKNARFNPTPPDIIFYGSNFIVSDHIYQKLAELNIPNLILQPTVYIDSYENWHEDYWYLTFTSEYDCWSRGKSEYDPDPMNLNGKDYFSIYNYQLDEDILINTNLNDRLLFKMGGDLSGHIVVHKSIASIFRTNNMDGAVLVPIADYGVSFYH
ncbi:hypothetical protein [Chromobacterium phragmitis]|uniref:Uncharacterized protein n=1 Tax=Chromobacterium phragmitis TaxID=2202141 RepID=A0ABV0IRV3_9NEIS